ncbi:YoaK family protein [Chelatococcus reniformis]|nr:DUF1275 family protein [Chelatococcus reniformis]
MPSRSSSPRPSPRLFALPLLLIAVAGFVDALGYLSLSGLFVSFMSGNTTQFAASLAGGNVTGVAAAGLLICCFVLGVAAGTAMVEASPRWSYAAILGLEALLLAGAAVAVAVDGVSELRLLPLAFAMGLQNNLRRTLAGARIGSTFVTGTLVTLGQGLARHLLGRAGIGAWLPHAMAWLALALGAALGAAILLAAGMVLALAGPAAVLALIACHQLRRGLVSPP